MLESTLASFLRPEFLETEAPAAGLWPAADLSPAADAVRQRCRTDLEAFAHTFFADECVHPFNAMHRDFFALHDARITQGTRGWRDATAAPRGSAKTTLKGKIEILHDVLYQHERYIGICSANADLARDKVKEIRDVLDTNTELRRVYGPQETHEWRMGDFVTQTGCRVRMFTPKSRVRGFLWRGLRPTKIVLDDAEDPETCLTPLRRERFAQWFQADVAKLGTEATNFDVIGTILHPESLLATLLQNPGYQARRYQAVLQFAQGPEAWDLWQQWRALVLDLGNEQRLVDARAFYDAHETAMLTGVTVLWPERQPYYALMLGRIIDGETAFWSEAQNEPTKDESYLFDTDALATFRCEPEGLARADGRFVRWLDMRACVAFWDPTVGENPSTHSDWSACPVVFEDHHGYRYCVDTYLEQQDDQDAQLEGLVNLCWQWQVPKLGIETNGFAATLVNVLRNKFAQRALEEHRQWEPLLVPVKHVGRGSAKHLRIRTLQPPLTNRWLWLAATLPAAAWQQLADYTLLTKNNVDDFPDALAGALAMLDQGEV